MKILQINSLHYRRGGADVVYLNTGRLLESKGHKVIYFSQKDSHNYYSEYSEYFVNKVNYFDNSVFKKAMLVIKFIYSNEAKNRLKLLIEKEKPEIAHIHLYKGTLTSSILTVLKKFKIPVVVTLHDYNLLCPRNSFLDSNGNICEKCLHVTSLNCVLNKCNRNSFALSFVSFLNFIFNKYIYRFEKYIDKLIPVSVFSYEKHIYRYRKHKDMFVHLYNFAPDLLQIKPNLYPGDYLLYFGRLSNEKGIETIIKSFIDNKTQLKLKIVGAGDMYEYLSKTINNYKLKNIELLGHKEGTELQNLIKNASFVVVPSEWYENNPLTVIEAYTLGKPVIASKIGGLPEIVIDNKTGFLFEMKNVKEFKDIIHKIEHLSLEQYKYFSSNARKFAEENFNEERHYNHLLNIYNSILAKKVY